MLYRVKDHCSINATDIDDPAKTYHFHGGDLLFYVGEREIDCKRTGKKKVKSLFIHDGNRCFYDNGSKHQTALEYLLYGWFPADVEMHHRPGKGSIVRVKE